MHEYKNTYAYEYYSELGFRIFRLCDTHARCLSKSVLSSIYLKMNNSKAKISKDFIPDNLYFFTSNLDLSSFNNNVRFSAEKISFMNKKNICSFRINKDSINYLKVYDYKWNNIQKILGYYNTINDYMICIYQTTNNIKYFSLKNNKGIYILNSIPYNI